MSEEKATIKKEIIWDKDKQVWRDWLGTTFRTVNTTSITTQPPSKARVSFNPARQQCKSFVESVMLSDMFAEMLATAPRSFRVDMAGSDWFLDEPAKDDGIFVFRGPIDLDHLVDGCIKDRRLGFIAIGPDTTFVGALSGVIKGCRPLPGCLESTSFVCEIDGYLVYCIAKKNTPSAVKWLPDVVADYRKVIKKRAHKIRKQRGKLSNEPETKVMTY